MSSRRKAGPGVTLVVTLAALLFASPLSGCAYIAAGIAVLAAGGGGGGGGRVNQAPSIQFPSIPSPVATDLVATVPYDLFDPDGDLIDILVDYSTDNGATFLPAAEGGGSDGIDDLESSATGTGHVYTWNFFSDLYANDLQLLQSMSFPVTLRFTLDDGVPRTLFPEDIVSFRVGNLPPTIALAPISVAPLDPTVLIDYTVTDDFSDPLDLIVEYSLDGFLTAGQAATILAPPSAQCSDGVIDVSSSPTGVNHCFEWDYLADLAGAAYPVVVRLTVTDTGGASSEALSGDLRLGNGPPVAFITLVDTQFGVNVDFIIADATSDTSSITFDYSTDNGVSYTTSTNVIGSTSGLATSPQGVSHNISWNSLPDIGTGFYPDTRVRITASDDYSTGAAVESDPFLLQNTDLPFAFISSPRGNEVASGAVQVDCLLVDFNSDPLDIVVEFRAGGSPTFAAASEVPGPPSEGQTALTSSQGGISHVFVWDSLADLGPVDLSDVELRITPSDSVGVGTAALQGPFRIDNNEEPAVRNISTPLSPATGNIAVAYELVDAEGDPADVRVQFSTDGGVTFSNHAHESPFGSDGVFLLATSPAGTPHVFVWNSLLDLGPTTQANVVIRITPSDGPDPDLGAGIADATVPFIVDNDPATAPPSIDAISPSAGDPAGGNGVIITGTGFIQGSTAQIGGQDLLNQSTVSASVIVGDAPPWTPGPTRVDVTVTSPNGTATLVDGYRYLVTFCMISSVAPAVGSIGGGTRVTIDGFNFAPEGIPPAVAFGDVSAINIVATDTRITCDTPADPMGVPGGNYSVDVMISNSMNHYCAQANGFTYDAVGTLAPSFGGKGLVISDGAAGGSGADSGLGIAADGSGRILITGLSQNAAQNDDMVVWRYNPDGSLDGLFGAQGWVIHDGAAGGAGNDRGNAIVIDGSGRIVVAGASENPALDADMALWRYNADGTLDVTFNSQGWITHGNAAGGNLQDEGLGLTVDRSGRILVTGYSRNAADEDMVIWRFLDTGALDASFNGQGWNLHHDAAGGNSDDRGTAVIVDASDRIVICGSSMGLGPVTGLDMAVWRYDAIGDLDASFGTGGVSVHHSASTNGGPDFGADVALDASGRILVAGRTLGAATDDDMAIWRLEPDGTLDATFGNGGLVLDHNAAGGAFNDRGNAIAVDGYGRIIVTGESQGVSFDNEMVVWRRDETGAPDFGFGAGGRIVQGNVAGGFGDDSGYGVAVDGSGRIIVAGGSLNPAAFDDMVVWRFNSDGSPDLSFIPGGFLTHDNVTGTGANPNDEGFGVTTDGLGRILVTGYSTDTDFIDDIVICAYNDDATLDASFGSGGVVVHLVAMSTPWRSEGRGILVDTLDRIVVGGWRYGSIDPEMAVVRDDAAGRGDPTFGGGEVFHDRAAGGAGFDGAMGVALDGSGRIVLVGYGENALPNSDMVIWRYNDDGTLDATFNGQGWVFHDNAAGGGGDDLGDAVALDGSGNILVAGSSLNGAGNTDMVIWRYDPTGALDVSFNGQGWVVHAGAAGGAGDDSGHGIAVDASGRIVVAGSSLNGTGDADMAIWRYDPTGVLDLTFNGQGFVIHDGAAGGAGDDSAMAIALDTSGRIIVAGYSTNASPNLDVVVWRYLDTGGLDPDFASGGLFVHDDAAGGAGDDIGYGIALDGSGRILVAGSSYNGVNIDLALWRLE